jgi:hypothetical protein
MAERAYTIEVDKVHRKVIKWTGLLNGDTGQWFPYAGYYPDKSMHVFGTAGAGLHVKPYGTNEGYDPLTPPSQAVQLKDATEDLIDITSVPDIAVILPNTEQVRVGVAGDGTTNITVIMEMKS